MFRKQEKPEKDDFEEKKTLVLKEKKEMSILGKFLMDTLEQYVDICMFCLGRRNMVDAVYSSDYEKPHKVNISITNKISCTEMILQNGTRKKL